MYNDHHWMLQALHIAESAGSLPRPNPRVGAVIVHNDTVLGSGHSQQAGGDHAEIVAIKQAITQHGKAVLSGATLYVTLEPCNHSGRTPPCTAAISEAAIQRIVIATADTNPTAAGGAEQLRKLGHTVEMGLMADTARQINRGFFSRIERNRPFVQLKIASTLDGVTALANGDSKWITNASARSDAHSLRAHNCAIVSGIGTVMADNPLFTIRPAPYHHTILGITPMPLWQPPQRIVLDSQLRIAENARILEDGNVWLVVAQKNILDSAKTRSLRNRGHDICFCGNADEQSIDIKSLLTLLAQRGINNVWVEAGASLNRSFLLNQAADEIVAYVSPQLLGRGRPWFEHGFTTVNDGLKVAVKNVQWISPPPEEATGTLRLTLQPQY